MTNEHEPGRDEWRPWDRPEDRRGRPAPAAGGPSPSVRSRSRSAPRVGRPGAGTGRARRSRARPRRPSRSRHPAPPGLRRTRRPRRPRASPSRPVAAWARLGRARRRLPRRRARRRHCSGASSAACSPTVAPSSAPARPSAAQPGRRRHHAADGSIANIAARRPRAWSRCASRAPTARHRLRLGLRRRSGHIVTNNHVVASAADAAEITVVLANGQQLEGPIVGADDSYDLAVVKVDRTDLEPLTLGRLRRRRRRRPGDRRRAPLGLDSTVTSGIVSALDRPVTRARRRPVLHQRHPDRRGDQPRQLGRPAARHAGPGHRGELRDRPRPRLLSAARAATSGSASPSRAPRCDHGASSSSRPGRPCTR